MCGPLHMILPLENQDLSLLDICHVGATFLFVFFPLEVSKTTIPLDYSVLLNDLCIVLPPQMCLLDCDFSPIQPPLHPSRPSNMPNFLHTSVSYQRIHSMPKRVPMLHGAEFRRIGVTMNTSSDKVYNFDLYRLVRPVHIGLLGYRYADRPWVVPQKIDRQRSIEGEIDRRQSIERKIGSIEGEKGKKKKKWKRRKKRGEKGKKEIPSAVLAHGSPARHCHPPPLFLPRDIAALARFFSCTRRRNVYPREEKDRDD
ncbi:hypothetical protein B296_00007257, partial [Ensete ventricosum]